MNPIRKIFERIINPVTLYEDSSSGGGAPQTNITNTNSTPWKPTIKYWNNEQSKYDPVTGQYILNKKPKAPMGVLQQTANFADTYGTLSPEEQQLMTGYQDTLGGRGIGIGNMQGLGTNLQNDLTGGTYNTNFGDVGDVTASLSNLNRARTAQGALDPTNALSEILRGDPTTNPYLAQMNQASINQSMQGYNDALQKAGQTVLPQIKQDAFASGQYGGSRQGIAEGIIGQQLGINARDLGQRAMDTGASLYGSAFENAQQRMAGAAGDLNTQAAQNEQYNASTLNDVAKFNADLAFKNRAQSMEQAQNNLNNALQAYNVGKATYADVTAAQDALYGTQTDVEKTQLQRTLDMLNIQSGIYGTASGLGGQSVSMGTSSAPSGGGSSTVGNILGGLSGATGLLSMAGGGGLGGVGGIVGSLL
jgi:hypothetical protein